MNLIWNRCQGNAWCNLNTVNLEHNHFDTMNGVYVIWHGGPNPATVRVGQGYIRERLRSHRTDPSIAAYAPLGLYVTWASVPEPQLRNRVERYLGDVLRPLVGERLPEIPPEQVNLPW